MSEVRSAPPVATSVLEARRRVIGAVALLAADGRPAVVTGPTDQATLAQLREAASALRTGDAPGAAVAATTPEGALVWLGCRASGPDGDGLRAALGELVRAGARVVVHVPAASAPRPDGGVPATRPGVGDPVAELTAALPGARVLTLRTVEAVVLAAPGEEAALAPPDAGEEERCDRLVCANLDEAALAALTARAEPADSRVRDTQLAALERAVAELRRANARLARERLGQYDSAAATVLQRADARAEELGTELEETRRQERMLAGRLQAPHYRVVGALVARAKRTRARLRG